MKTLIYMSFQSIPLAFALLLAFTTNCGQRSSDAKRRKPVAVDVGTEDSGKSSPGGESAETKVADGARFPTNLAELQLDLPGNFRIHKLTSDDDGNHYIALGVDLPQDDAETSKLGFAILKFDAEGKEIWRFPNRADAAEHNSEMIKLTSGPYVVGSLADFKVDDNGDLVLIGVKLGKAILTTDVLKDHGVANFSSESWVATRAEFVPPGPNPGLPETQPDYIGNIVFMARLKAAGPSEQSPAMSYYKTFATPVWWNPVGLTLTERGTLMLASTSNGQGALATMQFQEVSLDFKRVISSRCMLTLSPLLTSGNRDIVPAVRGTERAMVEQMTSPFTHPLAPFRAQDTADYIQQALSFHAINSGRCWDVLANRPMAESMPDTAIDRPDALAPGEATTFVAKEPAAIINGGGVEHALALEGCLSAASKQPAIWQENSQRQALSNSGCPPAIFIAMNSRVLMFGSGEPDVLGEEQLQVRLLGNEGRGVDPFELATTQSRQPSSLSGVSLGESAALLGWLDRHLSGERRAGMRSIHLAQIKPDADGHLKAEEFVLDPPDDLGFRSFTSVAVTGDHKGEATVFATASECGDCTVASRFEGNRVGLLIGTIP